MFSNASFECLLKLHTSSFALEIKLKIFIAEVVQSVHKRKILSIGMEGPPLSQLTIFSKEFYRLKEPNVIASLAQFCI